MKIIITLVIVLVLLLSFVGCWPWWGPEGGGYDRDGGREGHR